MSLIKITFSALLIASAVQLQAQSLTDPGISEHNYKMPNKAAIAKAREQHFIAPMGAAAVESGQAVKYAIRPASIVVAIDGKKEPMSINPLSSVANYKTQPVQKMQVSQEEYSASLN